jgi:Holliday junction resolvase RusA-like endonuclease
MINLTLPVYYEETFKTKPSKTFLLGMNVYRNIHFHLKNKVKVHFERLIVHQLLNLDPPKIVGKYQIEYVYYYKSTVSDLMNVVSLISKFTNDALQNYGAVVNDNVQYCIKESATVGGQDKLNPRVEIKITPYIEV